ncbi:hypothetical protein B0I35DRAFT_410717 [Stachybotrys elegans]|uniref:ATP-grasp domain-containing protein n=1 Tax=Stachybotrys elegans TaxID=80388 RepID=A0A8K0SP20_9HYPO|nr:hypothetical protein B0I35DRAFT_410717 [Stachybotrys elegans]
MAAEIARATPVAVLEKNLSQQSVREKPSHGPVELPPIVLDTTLTDLYRQASPRLADKRIAHVLSCINAAIDLTPHLPRNKKFVYHDACFNGANRDDDTAATGAKFRRKIAIRFLSLIAQRDAFICGPSDAVFFYIGDLPEQMAHDQAQAQETLSILPQHQRPQVTFCSGPDSIPVKDKGIGLLAYKIALDGLEKHNLSVPAETHWTLNSKLALATSGLPTPKCELVEPAGFIDEPSACCSSCRDNPAIFPVPESCDGPRGAWIKEQSKMICDGLLRKELPFVLKNQQTFGGAGTYIIRTAEERLQIIKDLQDRGILRKLLSSVTRANAHLRPGTLILSDMVKDPIRDYGLTFFVNDDGRDPTFLAASEQITTDQGAWMGSTINFSRQSELKSRFEPLIKEISRWLQSYDYVGPAGADVLETASSGTRPSQGEPDFSNYNIVDLNIRTSGSLCLPMLRSHFTSRGLQCVSSSSVSVRADRKHFINLFAEQFRSGSMCILSWYEDVESGVSVADVVIGAKDEAGLEKAMRHMSKITESVTF